MAAALLIAASANAQRAPTTASSAPLSDESIERKSRAWTAALALDDSARERRVADEIATHLHAVREWHDAHPSAALADATPGLAAAHTRLMTSLRGELAESQVDAVLDGYTVGKVAFTFEGYRVIVPDLTDAEASAILANLKAARERAIDQPTMRRISAVFGEGKDRCERLLNDNGRDWRSLYKAYVAKAQAAKTSSRPTTQRN